ncbi:uncharacterized protein BJ212DRAFT_1378940 [Suillus subaureus]|uniref:Uncharacterized protein n=1 Tax=Suillus subaureus TaxID=48587 RepID=A0A9P7E2C9_9AGAM|nr:uncharacterized protein BJ212DRAFT_1378940 [Suillus subaureus]KAG1809676.1 hypothetical protein BJ212DRAFT_1378940 [Suillus subaureus]
MSVVAITCTPWVSVLTVWVFALLEPPDVVSKMVAALYAILYATARAIILGLMFTTLRDLPPDAHKAVSWTSLMPHL